MISKKLLLSIAFVVVGSELALNAGAAGRDITVSCPVQACGDGLNSGVVTITCVQTNTSSSSGGKDALVPGTSAA